MSIPKLKDIAHTYKDKVLVKLLGGGRERTSGGIYLPTIKLATSIQVKIIALPENTTYTNMDYKGYIVDNSDETKVTRKIPYKVGDYGLMAYSNSSEVIYLDDGNPDKLGGSAYMFVYPDNIFVTYKLPKNAKVVED